jgi:hypothetical protein
MELPSWIYLPTDDYDVELVYAQMDQKLVEGIGFCGWREGVVVDPEELIGDRPGAADRALRARERKVLNQSKRDL